MPDDNLQGSAIDDTQPMCGIPRGIERRILDAVVSAGGELTTVPEYGPKTVAAVKGLEQRGWLSKSWRITEAGRQAHATPRDIKPRYTLPAEGTKAGRRRLRQLEAQRGRCFLCGKSIDPAAIGAGAPSTHHFIPLAAGGADVGFNKVIAHARCNSREGMQMPTLRLWLKFLLVHWRRGHVRGV